MAWHHVQRAASASFTVALVGLGVLAMIMHWQGAKFLSVQSGSMVPTFYKGDLMVVTDVPHQQYKVGDVITFVNPQNSKSTITHRIVAITTANSKPTGQIITKGDANAQRDKAIRVQAIVGKAGLRIPYLGYLYNFILQPIGLLLVIYIPTLSIIIGEIRRLITYYQQLEAYIAKGFEATLSKRF
jgi:signal peptidase